LPRFLYHLDNVLTVGEWPKVKSMLASLIPTQEASEKEWDVGAKNSAAVDFPEALW
jgi:hypothetical protein